MTGHFHFPYFEQCVHKIGEIIGLEILSIFGEIYTNQGLIQPNLDSDISLLGTPILGAQITVDTRKKNLAQRTSFNCDRISLFSAHRRKTTHKIFIFKPKNYHKPVKSHHRSCIKNINKQGSKHQDSQCSLSLVSFESNK